MILQTAGQRLHAFLLGVLGQVFLAGLLVNLALLGTLAVDFLFLGSKILLHNALGLAALHLQLVAGQHVLDSLSEVVDIQLAATHVSQLGADADT